MTDANFKVKNGLSVGSSGVIDYNSATSKLRFSNDGGSTFADLGSGGGGAEVFTKTANYTLALADANNIIEMNVATANTVTVPLDSSVNFPTGTRVTVTQIGTGQTEILPASGVTILDLATTTKISERYGTVSLYKRAANTWVLEGDLADEPQTKTGNYTLALSDIGSTIEMNVGSANTVTIPLDSTANFPIGSMIDVVQVGTGQTEIVGAGGVSILSKTSFRKLVAQGSAASIYKRAANTWVLFGDLGA